jgi:hypothetical protein
LHLLAYVECVEEVLAQVLSRGALRDLRSRHGDVDVRHHIVDGQAHGGAVVRAAIHLKVRVRVRQNENTKEKRRRRKITGSNLSNEEKE